MSESSNEARMRRQREAIEAAQAAGWTQETPAAARARLAREWEQRVDAIEAHLDRVGDESPQARARALRHAAAEHERAATGDRHTYGWSDSYATWLREWAAELLRDAVEIESEAGR